MDDTKVAEFVPRRQPGNIQSGVHAVDNWSCDHKMTLNADKSQVMNIEFKKNRHAFEPVIVDGRNSLLSTPLRFQERLCPVRDYASWFFLKSGFKPLLRCQFLSLSCKTCS